MIAALASLFLLFLSLSLSHVADAAVCLSVCVWVTFHFTLISRACESLNNSPIHLCTWTVTSYSLPLCLYRIFASVRREGINATCLVVGDRGCEKKEEHMQREERVYVECIELTRVVRCCCLNTLHASLVRQWEMYFSSNRTWNWVMVKKMCLRGECWCVKHVKRPLQHTEFVSSAV